MHRVVRLPSQLLGAETPQALQGVGTPEHARKVAQNSSRASQVLWLDQADAQAVAEGEEVTLMDWGNAIIRVRLCQRQLAHTNAGDQRLQLACLLPI